jgi:hypothetical protein
MQLICFILAALVAIALGSGTAQAEQRDFCADRPGLGTPACTLAPGQAMAEVGLSEWDHAADPSQVSDMLTAGAIVLRLGVTERSEVMLGFGGWSRERQRDRSTPAPAFAHGWGDITLGWKRGLAGPNGPVAIQTFVTLPSGKGLGTAGDWAAGVVVPVNLAMPGGFELDLSPEIDAAVNGSGSGRHLAYGAVFGLSHSLGKNLSGEVELCLKRDGDPDGHETQARLAASLAWQVAANWQVDLEADAGLRGSVPDHAVMIGFAQRFR